VFRGRSGGRAIGRGFTSIGTVEAERAVVAAVESLVTRDRLAAPLLESVGVRWPRAKKSQLKFLRTACAVSVPIPGKVHEAGGGVDAIPHLEAWHDAFVVIGGAAGALVGLLFIVVSLHFGRIEAGADTNTRATLDGARFNTVHLLIVLAEAVAVLTPQPALFLGAELIALNLLGARSPFAFIHRYAGKRLTISHESGFPSVLLATIIAAYALGVAGGVVVLRHAEWGLYLVTLSCLAKIARSVLTAWMLIFSLSHTRSAEPK